MKNCPKCGNKEWDYDVYDGIFTWCGDCYSQAKKEGFFKRFNELMLDVKDVEYKQSFLAHVANR